MSGMVFGQDRLSERLMGRMRKRVIERMVPGILKMTVPVHAGPFFRGDFLWGLPFRRLVSGGHNL